MAPEYTGRGDPRRSLALLWGLEEKPRRGPKRGLSVERVVTAAIELADAEGLSALSMRRVAERLGVGTMSLYTYVPAKGELLDLMVDATYAEQVEEMRVRTERDRPQGWRAELESLARVGWDLQLRHPWTLGVAASRSVLGPNESALFEAALRIVDGIGLSGREMVAAVDLVGTYVRGAVRAAAEAVAAPAVTGQTDTEWWLERAPVLEEIEAFRNDRFPTVVQVSQAGGFDVNDDAHDYTLAFALEDFEFGLQRVLDGIETLVAERQAGRHKSE
jgi:AcrR family transcriptional regulator